MSKERPGEKKGESLKARKLAIVEEATKRLKAFDGTVQFRYPTPYIVDVSAGHARSYNMGFGHSQDPEAPKFAVLQQELTRFADHERAQNPMLVVEGGWTMERVEPRLQGSSDRKREAIVQTGEMGFALEVAREAGMESCSIEPSELELLRAIEAKGGTREEIVAYHLLRSLDYRQRIAKKKPRTIHMAAEVLRDEFLLNLGWVEIPRQRWQELMNQDFVVLSEEVSARAAELADDPVMMQRCLELIKNLSGVDVRISPEDGVTLLSDLEQVRLATDPTTMKHRQRSNEICAMTSHARDQHIVREIGKLLVQGRSVFALYGAGHTWMQEPALRWMAEQLSALEAKDHP